MAMDEASLNSPEMEALALQLKQSAPALTRLLQRVDELERSGALGTVLDLADVAHALRISVSDGMVAQLSTSVRIALELADQVMMQAPAVQQAATEARAAAIADKRRLGLLDLARALKEPQVQYGLKFMLAFAGRLPATMQGSQE
ncbi:MAG: DUF1641 domain-containing protein [Mycobacterium leprae]